MSLARAIVLFGVVAAALALLGVGPATATIAPPGSCVATNHPHHRHRDLRFRHGEVVPHPTARQIALIAAATLRRITLTSARRSG